MQHLEAALQRTLAEYLHWALEPPAWFTAIPGGDRGRTTTYGYRKGCPDLLIVSGGRCWFLELKSPKGVLSSSQKALHAMFAATGIPVAVVRSLTETRTQLALWGIPTRETKPSTEAIKRGLLSGL